MTSQERFKRAQDDAMPKESLDPYRGQWVALREGSVVASSIDAMLLYEGAAVRHGDVLLAVPFEDDAVLVV